MIIPPLTAYREYPVLFSAGQEQIFGVYTVPIREVQAGGDAAVVLLTGGGFIPGSHRNRMWVRLARRLGAAGIPALRVDYRGVGESTGRTLEFWLDRPFVEDLDGAVRWLRERGVTRVALAGSCFGARTILETAEGIAGLAGAVLLSVPLRGHRWGEYAATRFATELTVADYVHRAARARVLRRLLDRRWREAYLRVLRVKARSVVGRLRAGRRPDEIPDGLGWMSPKFVIPLRHLVGRRVPLLFLYGSEDEYYREFQRALVEGLDRLIGQADGALEIRTVEGVLHGFTTLEMQEAAIGQAFDWISTRLAMLPATMEPTR